MNSIRMTLGIACISALAAVPMFAANPPHISNSIKYKDAGAKPATGRSGSAAIQVRALRGRETTDIEVTTGQFDTVTPPSPGKLDKLQLKIFDSAGDPIVNRNVRTFGSGYALIQYTWPMRGQGLQVQANVGGFDPKRTDVVTVPTTVKMRPDLTVASIHTSSPAYVGSVVTIEAVIREANGDLGARANCILKADGAVIGQSNGIWVDAGDAVTVDFHTTFATLGEKHLTVELQNVRPLDYDTTNNSKSAAINVISLANPLYYTMDAEDTWYDQTGSQREHEEFTAMVPEATSYVRDTTGGHTDNTHVVSYGANLQIEQAVQFPVALESTLTVDGQPLLSASGTVDEDPDSYMNFSGDGYWNRCGSFWDGWTFVFVCHFHSEFDGIVRDLSTAYSGSNAGFVTYHGWGTTQTQYADGTLDVYDFNGTYDYVSGTLLSPMPAALGNNIQVHGSFTDAANQHLEADSAVQLFPAPDYTYDYGEYCYNYDYIQDGWGEYSGYQCSYPVTLQHGTAGWNSGTLYY